MQCMPAEKHTPDHSNWVQDDNDASNLQWATRSQHAHQYGNSHGYMRRWWRLCSTEAPSAPHVPMAVAILVS